MENTNIIIAITFFLLFWTIVMYNFISALSGSGLKEVCPDFVTKFEKVSNIKMFSTGGEINAFNKQKLNTTKGVCTVNMAGIDCPDNSWDTQTGIFATIGSFVIGITDFVKYIINILASFIGIISSFGVIMSTNCPDIVWLKIIFTIVFMPMFMGLMYIVIRLIKSMIPTVGGN